VTNHVDFLGRTNLLEWLATGKLAAMRRPMTDGSTNTVECEYDQQMNLAGVKDSKGRWVERYGRDAMERVAAITNLEGQVLSVTYGGGDLPATVNRFDGSMVRFAYFTNTEDAVYPGLPIRIQYPDSTVDSRYWADGRLKWTSNEEGRVEFAFDLLGR
jgi:YD repeat-containing protein